MSLDKKYWDDFYKEFKIDEPSSFAEFVSNQKLSPDLIIDIGCGNGRDTAFLTKRFKCVVLGLDSSESAVVETNARLESSNSRAIEFGIGRDNLASVLSIPELNTSGSLLVYSRFVLHALDEIGEAAFWDLLKLLNSSFDVDVAIEYRTVEDESLPKMTPSHYRRFLVPDQVSQRAKDLAFDVIFETVGRGLAVYGDDDPHLCRQLFRKSRVSEQN